jgi:hypothetical protein
MSGSSDSSLPDDTAQVGTDQPKAGGQLWLRRWSLTIGDVTGAKALDLSWLAFTFSVKQQQLASPWSATITVYNVSNDLLNSVDTQKEYTNVRLEAGYWSGQYGVLFEGPIVYYRSGRKDATDTFIEIYAAVADMAFSQAIINSWLPAGHVKQDVLNAAIASFGPYGMGIVAGQITQLSQQQATRGRTLFGMTASILRDIARSEDAQWFIDQDKKLHLLRQDEAISLADTTVPILNSRTGMIGVPEQTLGGAVNVRCLLNPAIRPGKKIQLNQADVVHYTAINPDAAMNAQLAFDLSKTQNEQARHADGFYTVGAVEHTGESRGNTWYTNIVTVSFNEPQSQRPQVSAPR